MPVCAQDAPPGGSAPGPRRESSLPRAPTCVQAAADAAGGTGTSRVVPAGNLWQPLTTSPAASPQPALAGAAHSRPSLSGSESALSGRPQ